MPPEVSHHDNIHLTGPPAPGEVPKQRCGDEGALDALLEVGRNGLDAADDCAKELLGRMMPANRLKANFNKKLKGASSCI